MTDKLECSSGCCHHPASSQVQAVVDGANLVTSSFFINDLDCTDCAAKLERGLARLKGVSAAKVNFSAAKLKVTYDSALIKPPDVVKVIEGYGYRVELLGAEQGQSGCSKTLLRVGGLDCGECAAGLEKKIAHMAGVRSAVVNFATGILTVEHTLDEREIIQAVERAGFTAEKYLPASKSMPQEGWRSNPRTQTTIISGLLFACAVVVNWLGGSEAVVIGLYAATAIVGGYHPARAGFYAVRDLSVDMNFLMTTAIIGAAAIGEWSEGAAVAFLFALGNTLQTYTMDKTRRSIRALMELAPPEALVLRDGQEQRLPVEAVTIDDTILVKPGERIAMDGMVLSGSSAVDQAPITGESLPVGKNAGDAVFAGTVNGHGALAIKVTKVAADSTLAKIMHLVEEAQAEKAPSQQLVDVFAKYYTPAVLFAACAVMIVPWLLLDQPFAPWFYKGLVLLVISCPCALVISTPVSIVSAIGNASRQGVLIKGGAYLERIGSIQAVAFDKTGTLTYGHPVVTDIVPLNGMKSDDLLDMAAAVEKWSEHPLAQAIMAQVHSESIKPAVNFQALVGRGAQAEIDGETIYVGNLRLFEELGHVPALYEAGLEALERQGKTVIFVGTTQANFGMIAIADTVRQNAADAVLALRSAGMRHVAMITGDNRRVAEAIGGQLALNAVYSDLMPEDKVTAVQKLRRQYGSMVMVGDGINDAPALAAADVGIAMGGAGTDVALETADIALMGDDLGKLAYIVKLSRKTVAVIKQNISFAITVKTAFVILTFAGLANLWLAVFADMGAALLVTFNGMRLMRRLS